MPRPSTPAAKPHRPPCPRCGSASVEAHGSFALKNGTRQSRSLCHGCGRTFSPHTGTPLCYLKKRDRWAAHAQRLVQGLSLRRTATELGIAVSTAFRWRHRLLAPLCRQPQPVLTATVVAGETYLPYSEKGSRCSDGPGAYGVRSAPAGARLAPDQGGKADSPGQGNPNQGIPRQGTPPRKRFRRLTDGKSSCVLLACAGEQHAVAIVGRGRPAPAELQSCLAGVLGAGAELWSSGLAPFAQVCLSLGVRHLGVWGEPLKSVDRLRSRLYAWLTRFHGVATRYLQNYLVWYRLAGPLTGQRPAVMAEAMLAMANAHLPPRQVA